MSAPFEQKICPPQQLAARLASCARPLVFTNGVFDILHRGHVTYLAEARALGSMLLVAINGDASAKRLGKGGERPFNALADRIAVPAAIVGAAEVRGWGGSVHSIPFRHQRSTTALLKKIREP